MAKILVVDDDESSREMTATSLRMNGHDVTEATNGQQALASFQPRKFDLVITDKQMPGLTGNELLTEIRDAEEKAGVKITERVFVILLSGTIDVTDGAFDAILPKPVKIAILNAIATAGDFR